MDRSYVTQIASSRSRAEESEGVVGSCSTASVPADWMRDLIAAGRGQPVLPRRAGPGRADGARTAAPPTTIQQVLLARIDRFADGARRLLETAAVLGREPRRACS